ncbi:anosmin-1 [Venturia canescens]|uniref:anosmin-1 n=1 Tax=Venturia canescens TaxID=32260 RepID=UPI001C9D0581|nr:anosmin-1 [Venturia canescens]
MIVSRSKWWWSWWFLVPVCLSSWTKYVEEYDSMGVARCDAKCSDSTRTEQCMDSCLTANYTKPGNCPEENSMSPFEAACIIACANDSQCPDLAKCCPNDCGVTCMRPTGFDDRNDIPSIPENIEIRREKSNLVILSWKVKPSLDSNRNESTVRYLVEERHSLGPRYLESRLSSWSVRHVSNKPHASLRAGLKSGHWYQFRVAAVNVNGSRGYSSPSAAFKTMEPRNPREPRNLSLSGARVQADGKLRILLRWRPPPSDVPIMFYKLFWSRLIHGPANDSILVNHRTVSKEKVCYEVKNLELGCQYFLQVQAVAVYGGRRLASRKASKVFNSTDYKNYADGEGRSRKCERHNQGLRVRRLICQCGGEQIEARLVWPPDPDATSYNVTWTEETCGSLANNEESTKSNQRISGTRTTEKTRLDIKGLRRKCTYTLNVRSVSSPGRRRERDRNRLEDRKIGIEFVTNDCEYRKTKRGERERNSESSRCRRRKARIKRFFH